MKVQMEAENEVQTEKTLIEFTDFLSNAKITLVKSCTLEDEIFSVVFTNVNSTNTICQTNDYTLAVKWLFSSIDKYAVAIPTIRVDDSVVQ